jgi:hypothetical protein
MKKADRNDQDQDSDELGPGIQSLHESGLGGVRVRKNKFGQHSSYAPQGPGQEKKADPFTNPLGIRTIYQFAVCLKPIWQKHKPKRCINFINDITPTLPSPLWRGRIKVGGMNSPQVNS